MKCHGNSCLHECNSPQLKKSLKQPLHNPNHANDLIHWQFIRKQWSLPSLVLHQLIGQVLNYRGVHWRKYTSGQFHMLQNSGEISCISCYLCSPLAHAWIQNLCPIPGVRCTSCPLASEACSSQQRKLHLCHSHSRKSCREQNMCVNLPSCPHPLPWIP